MADEEAQTSFPGLVNSFGKGRLGTAGYAQLTAEGDIKPALVQTLFSKAVGCCSFLTSEAMELLGMG